jgi:hypothetical protein
MKYKLIAVVGILTLTSCGGGKKSIKKAQQATTNAAREFQMMSTWESDCFGGSSIGSSKKEFYKFSGDDFIKSTEYFAKDDCKEALSRLNYHGQFKVGDRNEDNEKVRNLTLEYKKVEMIPLSAEGVDLLQSSTFCSVQAWKLREAVDLTVHSGDTWCPLYHVPQKRYDIIQVKSVEGNKRLFLGKTDQQGISTGKKSLDLRPVDVDKDKPLHETTHKLVD